MKQIAIVSGKGGTGKTSIAASFASLAGKCVIADCDVDASTLHLLLNPRVLVQQEFRGSKLASIDKEKCIECLLCEKACRYGAIRNLRVDPFLCEGCGVCAFLCPKGAIELTEKVSGYAYISETKYGPMAHAKLGAAEANSGKLVALVRQNAILLAKQKGLDLIIIDGPPGIGCPVIASLTGVDIAVMVAEPTFSGIHDLQRIMGLAEHFRLKPLAIVNMYDLNEENGARIIDFCEARCVEVLAKIPFDPSVTEAMVQGKTVVEYAPHAPASVKIREAWEKIKG
jgi:MinD superfamily P-loop ATPase